MPWKLDVAMTAIAVSMSGLIEQLGRQRSGWLLLAGAVGLGIGIASGGYWARDLYVDQLEYGPRIVALEDWREAHMDTITLPALERIDRLQERHDMLEELWEQDVGMIREMTFQLYCDRFPTRCALQP